MKNNRNYYIDPYLSKCIIPRSRLGTPNLFFKNPDQEICVGAYVKGLFHQVNFGGSKL